MLASSPGTHGTILASLTSAVLALTASTAAFDHAHAQTKLTANYTISLARIPIGKIGWTADIGEASYTTSGSGEASGLLSVLASGKGTAATQGTVGDGGLSPTRFTSDLTRDDDKAALSMAIERGAVTDVSGAAREASETRVPLTDAHRRNIVDPLTALLIPAAAGNGVARAACERTLPIFDGHRRYNLKLAFKRIDKAKIDKRYDGPAVVCALTFEPVAGHRADSKLVKFLSQDRDIELWLAPVAPARLLAPVRLSISNMFGNLVVQATEFQATAPLPARAAL